MNVPIWIRRKFFDSYGEGPNEQKAELPPRGIRSNCPCCGFQTLGKRGCYSICELCNWEDDGQDASDADEVKGGPNFHYSLTEAQLNFEKYLVMYPPEKDKRIGGADSENVRELKRNLMTIFNAMMNEPSTEEINCLWQKVDKIEKALRQNTKDVIKEYEAKIIAEREKTKSL